MAERADVSDIDAIEQFRARLVRYCESANAALSSADAEVARALTWLESEMIPYWDKAVRDATAAVAEAKTKWREKALFKDATGARHSAVDEKAMLDKAVRRLEDAVARHAAARRELLRLRRDESAYKGPSSRLANFVGGSLADAAARLRQVVEQLEKYQDARPQAGGSARFSAGESTSTARPDAPPEPHEPHEPTPQGPGGDPIAAATTAAELLALIAGLTPASRVRAAATRRADVPAMPLIPPEARDALSAHLLEIRFGKYDLVTSMLPPGAEAGRVYLERREPANATDTGWHLGPARDADGRADATTPGCGILTFAKLADAAPDWADLLRLPVGTLLLADAGELVAAVDPLGRALWWAA